jgi:hypothetical protein
MLEADPEGLSWCSSAEFPPETLNVTFEPHLEPREEPTFHGVKSGEHGGWLMVGIFFFAKECCILRKV